MTETILKVNNVVGTLITSDQHLKDVLVEQLRFRPKNYYFNPLYRAKKWDGYKYFFDKKTNNFLAGILPEIQLVLRHLKKEYVFLDERTKVDWAHKSIDDQFLNAYLPEDTDPITLHDFQPDLVNQCIIHRRGVVQAPTGAGKTFILISLLKCLPPTAKVLFLTKSAGLVHQNYLEMKKWGVQNLGRWYDDYKEPNQVICGTVHKATFESLEKQLPEFDALIVDEVHDCMSDVPLKAYKKMKKCGVRVGISATTFKWDNKKIDQTQKWSVKGNFGPIFKTTTTADGTLKAKDLQERGILSASDCSFYPIASPDLAYEPFQDAVKLGIEQNFYFHEVVAKLAKTCTGRTLIVVERIEQGEYLKSLIPDSNFIQGETKIKDRQPVIEALLKGERSVAIVMRQIITAGINVKIHDLINAAGGNAAHNVIQLIGRGLRTAADKDILRYHDFLFLMNPYLKRHSEWRIEILKNQGHKVTVKESVDFL
jgi:superfamily II DNA or RNA helicase